MTTKNAGPQAGTTAAALRQRAIASLTAGRLMEGIALLEQALSLNPADGGLHADLGTAHWQGGHPEKAESHYRKAVQHAPRDPFALNAYGVFLLEQWRLDEAGRLLKRALAAKPDFAEALNNAGLLQHRLGNFAEAKKLLLEAMRRAPRWASPSANLGATFHALGDAVKAEQAFKQALKTDPRNAFAWCELGEVFFTARRDQEAAECFSRARALAPAMDIAWARSLALLERTNRTEDAEALLAEAKRRCPASPGIALQEARLLRRAGRTAEGIAALEKLRPPENAAQDGAYRPFLSELYAELGQLYDRAGDADRAFDCFASANAMEARRPDVRADDHTAVLRTIARLKQEFTPELAKGPAPAALPPGRPEPVFLVGFPRSGTTLLDQILSSHPDVFVAEEKGVVNELAKSLNTGEGPGYPQALAQLPEDAIARMQERFFAAHGLAPGSARRVFVDKLPLNLFHAGFIRRVFPQAKFVLALRHPCDSVLSCYMQLFRLNQSMKNFLDLGDAARLYDAALGLWEHYAQSIPLEAHKIRYEDVVGDFRATVGDLLSFLGLPWDEAVTEYDRTARERGRIGTPSYHQVTEKIYTRARGRWLNYRRHMAPVLDILAPHAERYGYSMADAPQEKE